MTSGLHSGRRQPVRHRRRHRLRLRAGWHHALCGLRDGPGCRAGGHAERRGVVHVGVGRRAHDALPQARANVSKRRPNSLIAQSPNRPIAQSPNRPIAQSPQSPQSPNRPNRPIASASTIRTTSWRRTASRGSWVRSAPASLPTGPSTPRRPNSTGMACSTGGYP